MSDAVIEITLLANVRGPLTKSIDRGTNGKLDIDGSACLMVDGAATRIKLDNIEAAAKFVGERKRDEAIALGRLHPGLPDTVKITTVARLERLNGTAPANLITRTANYIAYAPGERALVLVDIDTKGMPVGVEDKIAAGGEMQDALIAILPAIGSTSRFLRRSTSSGIRMLDTGEEFPGSKGFHLYLEVQDGGDAVRFLKDFHDRAWLAGYGWHMIGAGGQLLDRSLVDRMVGAGERLVFEGKPDLGHLLEQDHDARRPIVFPGKVLDTLAACPPLTDDECAQLDGLKAQSAARLQPQANAAREQHVETHAKKLAKERGISLDKARHIIRQQTHGVVLPDAPLPWDRKDFAGCTVRDILADPSRFIGQTMADPLEGVSYGRCKAKVYQRRDGSLIITSRAHGGKVYQIKDDDEPPPDTDDPGYQPQEDVGISRNDFYAYMPMHNYIYAPGRAHWPAASVNSRLPPVKLTDPSGNPVRDETGKQVKIPAASWIDRNKPVEQMTWAPGLPMVIKDKLILDGGWIRKIGAAVFNLYRPAEPFPGGDPAKAQKWIDHTKFVYPDDASHIISWLAHRVQHPEVKINHALVLGGDQGIGKDTLLEPVKHAIGPWNCQEASPQQILGRFNGFLKSVILRVSEARDLGEYDRFGFYDHMKTYTAAPPDTLRIDEKHLREYYIPNVCGVIITTNHKNDGIFLSEDDRRHYVAWSSRQKEDQKFQGGYWQDMWKWYATEGTAHVAAYLREHDLSGFDPKAPPPKTAAWWSIVDSNRPAEESELADAIDKLTDKRAITVILLRTNTSDASLAEWLDDRKNRRTIPYRLEKCGYVPVRNAAAKSGLWVISGKRQAIYAQASLTLRQQVEAAQWLAGEPPHPPKPTADDEFDPYNERR
jgi:hypothetical protein